MANLSDYHGTLTFDKNKKELVDKMLEITSEWYYRMEKTDEVKYIDDNTMMYEISGFGRWSFETTMQYFFERLSFDLKKEEREKYISLKLKFEVDDIEEGVEFALHQILEITCIKGEDDKLADKINNVETTYYDYDAKTLEKVFGYDETCDTFTEFGMNNAKNMIKQYKIKELYILLDKNLKEWKEFFDNQNYTYSCFEDFENMIIDILEE